MIDQKEPTFDLESQDQVFSETIAAQSNYFKKVIKITPEEFKNHDRYLKSNLKKFLIKSFIIKFFEINFFLI